MSDDIDIEEHDVMASLAEKDVFVDLSIVKREVLDIEYEESLSGTHQSNLLSPHMTATCSVEVHNADSTTDDLPELPPASESPITVSSSDNVEMITADRDLVCYNYGDDYEKLKEEARSNVTKVMLKDWGFYISQCKSYCARCEILFPTENALAAHDMLSHSYLVAVEGNNTTTTSSVQTSSLHSDSTDSVRIRRSASAIRRQGDCFKCLLCYKKFSHRTNAQRHYSNVHQIPPTHVESDSESSISVSSKSTNYSHRMSLSYGETVRMVENRSGSIYKITSDQSPSTNNTCQLCGEFFINKDLLLNHLYEKHFPTKSYNCEQCNSTFPTKNLLLQHTCMRISNQRIEENEIFVNPDQQLEPRDTSVFEGFRCNICFCYYLTMVNVLLHMSECHKQSLKTVPEELIVNKINLTCPFCSGYFKYVQSYNKHIKDKHPEKVVALSADKSFKPELMFKKEKDIPYQKYPIYHTEKVIKLHNGYRCGLCLKVFSKYNSAYHHRVKHHANIKRHIVSKTSIIQKVDSDLRTVSKCNENGVLLPKNFIYKCPNCKIYSTSISDTEDHIEKHSLDTDCMNTKKCDKCNLHFTLSSIKSHLKQHNFSQNFTKIVVEKTDVFKERILHKCPKCMIHFSESSLKKHYWACGNVLVKSNLCIKCNIAIESNSYFYHQKYHQLNLVDMVVVNYICVNGTVETGVRRWKFFYCEKCTCYITNTEARFSTHKSGKCLKFEKDVCPYCGLMLPLPALNYHMRFHETVDGMNFRNYDFYNNIGPPGKIYPPPPLFPKCDECEVHFESLNAKFAHACANLATVNCQYCNIKLTSRAHVFHLYYHNYSNKTLSKKRITGRGNANDDRTLDILYSCISCNVAVDSYDDLVRHCQMRQLDMPSSTMLCDVCDLNFDEACYDRHMRRHVRSDVARRDFKIIAFSEAEFFKPNWFSVFYIKDGVANIGTMENIVKVSIYKRVKLVKLHLHKNGKPECVLYQCAFCHTIVNKDFVFPHTLKYIDGGCRQQIKHKCNICNFKCIGTLSLKRHKNEFDHNEKNYSLVRFNYPEDKDYNMELMKLYGHNARNKIEVSNNFPNENEKRIATKQEEESIDNSDTYEKLENIDESTSDAAKSTNRITYKMYQCHVCKIVINSKTSCLRHLRGNCGKKYNRITCKKCNISFCSTIWRKHIECHRKFKDLKRENITLVTFFKAGAKIKFSLRNSAFEAITESVTEEQPKYNRQDVQPVKKYSFYQCRNCGTCVTSSSGARKHTTFIYNCKEMRKKLQKCPICGLKFYQNLNSHMQMHDDHRDMDRKTVKLIPFGDRNDTEDSDSHSDEPSKNSNIYTEIQNTETSKKQYILYKCTECDLCMSSKEGMRLHKSQRPHSFSSRYTKCELCNCKFSNSTMHNHMMKHRTYDNYVIDNIEIISFSTNSQLMEEMRTPVEHVKEEEAFTENETDVDSQASTSIVSQSSTKAYKLYRCIKCGLYLNTKYNIHHHITQANASDHKTCKICDFTFTPKSLQYHMRQHEKPNYTVDNIEIVEFDGKTLSGEGTSTQNSDFVDDTDQSLTSSMQINESEENNYVLYKCMECDVCVKTMYGAYKHIFYSSHMKAGAKECPSCNYKFTLSNLILHEKMHAKYKDYTADNIKIVAFDQKPIPGGKVVSNIYFKEIYPGRSFISQNTFEKHHATSKKYVIYKCSECKIHTNTKKHTYTHRNNLHNRSVASYYCKLCRLKFSHRSYVVHKRMHRKHKDYTRNNIEVITISPKPNKTLSRTAETSRSDLITISQTEKKYVLYKCIKCDFYIHSRKCVNFHFKMQHRLAHGYKTCTMCNYKFSKKGWLLHNRLHRKFKDYIKENIKIVKLHHEPEPGQPISSCTAVQMETSTPQKSSLGKYTLYKCVQCQLCLNSKRSARAHNTRSLHSSDHNVGYCKYCNCKFRNKSLAVHLKLHRMYKDFVIENIKFIEFGQKSAVSLSIRNLHNDVQQHSKQFVLYKCSECGLCMNNKKSADRHENRSQHNHMDSLDCKVCQLKFSKKGMFYHKLLHKQNKNLSADNIRIVEFGKETVEHEDSSNDVDSEEHHQMDLSEPENLHNDGQIESTKIVLYKCRTCSLCVQTFKGAEDHLRVNVTHFLAHGERICVHCGHKFSKRGIHPHLLLHKKYKNYTKDIIQVIEFGEESEPVESDSRKRKYDACMDATSSELLEKEARLFKCSCGLHFLNENSIEKHLRICGKDDGITKQNCSRCGLEFTAESLFSHLCTHHGNSKYKYKYEIIDMAPSLAKEHIILYKCIKCETHFLGCNGAKKHSNSCRGIESRKVSRECDKCGLYFHHQVLMEHQMYHHTLTKSVVSYEYKIIDISDGIDNSGTKVNSLYKCLACDIYFLKKPSIEEHVNIAHSTKIDIKTMDCEICNLTFTFRALAVHKKIHHEKYNIDEFEIHEYDSISKMEVAMKQHRVVNATKEDAINSTINDISEESKVDDSLEEPNAEVATTKEKKKEISNILYKCSECNVHYLKESTVYKHTIKNHQRIHPTDVFECKHCGLNFRALTLAPHTRQHHFDNNFERKDFVIHEYEPLTRETILKNKKSTPRITIYNAVDDIKSVDTCEKLNNVQEEDMKESDPIESLDDVEGLENIKNTIADDEGFINNQEVNKVNSDRKSADKDFCIVTCNEDEHEDKDANLSESVMDVKTHSNEMSIRNFIIFES